MLVEVLAAVVVDGGCPGIGVTGGDLDLPQRNSGIEGAHDERGPEHVRVNVTTPARLAIERTQRWAVRRSRRGSCRLEDLEAGIGGPLKRTLAGRSGRRPAFAPDTEPRRRQLPTRPRRGDVLEGRRRSIVTGITAVISTSLSGTQQTSCRPSACHVGPALRGTRERLPRSPRPTSPQAGSRCHPRRVRHVVDDDVLLVGQWHAGSEQPRRTAAGSAIDV